MGKPKTAFYECPNCKQKFHDYVRAYNIGKDKFELVHPKKCSWCGTGLVRRTPK